MTNKNPKGDETEDQVVAETAEDPAKNKKYWIRGSQRFGSPPRVIFFTLVIFLVSQFVAGIAVGLIAMTQGIATGSIDSWVTNSVLAQFTFTFIAEALVVALILALLHYSHLKRSQIGLKKPSGDFIGKALIGFVAFYALVIVAYIVLAVIFPEINVANQDQDIGFKSVSGDNQLLLTFISLVILPPIAEEVLMRGYLFSSLRSHLKFMPAAIITSLLFGLAHIQTGSGSAVLWTAAVNTFILSLVLVHLREKTGNIWAGVIVHALNNLVAFIVRFHASF